MTLIGGKLKMKSCSTSNAKVTKITITKKNKLCDCSLSIHTHTGQRKGKKIIIKKQTKKPENKGGKWEDGRRVECKQEPGQSG